MKFQIQVALIAAVLSVALFTSTEAFLGFDFYRYFSTYSPPRPLSCNSVLVQGNPDNYPHCYCHYGQFGPYKFIQEVVSRTCASQSAYKLQRSRSPLSSKCSMKGVQTETKYACTPTIPQMAQKFIETFNLGKPGSTSGGANLAVIPDGGSRITPDLAVIVPDGGSRIAPAVIVPDGGSRITPDLGTRLESDEDDEDILNNIVPFKFGRKKRNILYECPASTSQKRVCSSLTAGNCRGKRHRSADEEVKDNIRLAELVQAQDDFYKSKRQKRQATKYTSRNIIFVVDSSGSIPRSTFDRVLKVLSNFTTYFCGEVRIGMMTYSRHINLEFCPQCHYANSGNRANYNSIVQSKIKGATYHGSSTYTGEVVKCLKDTVLPSPRCPDTRKLTQVVFFTDGKANGCENVKQAINDLKTARPSVEIYAIGMGSIKTNGVTDLFAGRDYDNIFFNVKDITDLERLGNYVDLLITHNYNGNYTCASTRTPPTPPSG